MNGKNNEHTADDGYVIEDSLLNDESSTDLMVVNLTNTADPKIGVVEKLNETKLP